MSPPVRIQTKTWTGIWGGATAVLAGSVSLAAHVSSVFGDSTVAQAVISDGLWRKAVTALGSTIRGSDGSTVADVPLVPLLPAIAAMAGLVWFVGSWWIARRRGITLYDALARFGLAGWVWWLVPLGWELAATLADLAQATGFRAFLLGILPFTWSTLAAGWLATLCLFCRKPVPDPGSWQTRVPVAVWGAGIGYFLMFGAMNWLLYESLLLPHGDSAMYEEHVWNLLHGKGFRSYLDNGRQFLGEHVQLIHLGVIPLYLLWPSHVLLELCQSAALAAGAIPVFRLAVRHTGSARAATLLALAYLLYFPMQFLDIAVDFKTFRPNSFEIPLFLLALDALEGRNSRLFFTWLGMALICQEDAAMIIAPLGVWMAVWEFAAATRQGTRAAGPGPRPTITARIRRPAVQTGIGLAAFGVVYLMLVIKLILPYFRGGADVHFAQYFAELGGSSSEIVANLVRHPGLLLAHLFKSESAIFAVGLLVPLGGLPLLSPGRLAVAAPLFGVLCLSDITNSPQHHFHAPIVPILFWAAAGGLANAGQMHTRLAALANRIWKRDSAKSKLVERRIPAESFTQSGRWLPTTDTIGSAGTAWTHSVPRDTGPSQTAATWGLCCAAFTGALIGLSPLGLGFWDSASRGYWRNLYLPGERAARFPIALALVPQDSHVASTDYIHPRFTHHARSYDYSYFRQDVPADADFIVIDTRHPYSGIKRPEELKEFRDGSGEWEVLPNETEGYFIVLRRCRHDERPTGQASEPGLH